MLKIGYVSKFEEKLVAFAEAIREKATGSDIMVSDPKQVSDDEFAVIMTIGDVDENPLHIALNYDEMFFPRSYLTNKFHRAIFE